MSHMRRFFLILLCMMLALGLCACSHVGQETKEEDLPQLVIGGSIYEPYFYRDINGDYAGIDVELAKEACRRIGMQPVFRELQLDERFQALAQDRVDCLWCALTMSGREDRYTWAGPYLYAQRVIVVKQDSDIENLQDLEGVRVAVQTGSTSESIILNHTNPDLPEFGQLTVLDELGEVFTALRKGYVDAIAGVEGGLSVYLQEYPGQYRILNMSIRSEPLGVAFSQDGDGEVAKQLSQAFEDMRTDGTIEKIVTSYGLDVEKNLYGGLDDAIAKAN